MKFGRYLALMASTWVLAAAAVVGFTLLVDAIGISPVRVAIAGFNASKPLRHDYDWIVKRYEVRRAQPTTVFMGSSRVKQSIDPKLVAKTGFAPAYNGALNGSANFAETSAYLRDFLRADKYVFIEAFAAVFLCNPKMEPETRQSACGSETEPEPSTLCPDEAASEAPLASCDRDTRTETQPFVALPRTKR
jgi:hypothetical protein